MIAPPSLTGPKLRATLPWNSIVSMEAPARGYYLRHVDCRAPRFRPLFYGTGVSSVTPEQRQ